MGWLSRNFSSDLSSALRAYYRELKISPNGAAELRLVHAAVPDLPDLGAQLAAGVSVASWCGGAVLGVRHSPSARRPAAQPIAVAASVAGGSRSIATRPGGRHRDGSLMSSF